MSRATGGGGGGGQGEGVVGKLLPQLSSPSFWTTLDCRHLHVL